MNKLILTAALILGFILGAGFQHSRIASQQAKHQAVLRELAQKTADTYKAVINYTAVTDTELSNLRKVAYEDRIKVSDDYNDTVDSYGNWLRTLQDTAVPTSFSSAPSTGSRGPSKQDQATFDLFIELLAGHSKELVEIGKYAEELKGAGLMCEKSYDIFGNPPYQLDK